MRHPVIIRQGITLAGIDVVIVAASIEDIDACRALTEQAVAQYGPLILTRAGHPPLNGDPVLTAPIGDWVDGRLHLLGYVELAP